MAGGTFGTAQVTLSQAKDVRFALCSRAPNAAQLSNLWCGDSCDRVTSNKVATQGALNACLDAMIRNPVFGLGRAVSGYTRYELLLAPRKAVAGRK